MDKFNHGIYKKVKKESEKLWSFSRISSYENCPHDYFLSLTNKSENNIYTLCGTLAHDILEDYYEGKVQIEDMLKLYNDGILKILSEGYKFPNDKIMDSYLSNMRLYFYNFTPDNNIQKCEEFIAIPLWKYSKNKSLNSHMFNGWLDVLVRNEDGTVSIGDFKSSSIFTGKDLKSKSKQLILYAIGYEILYGEKVKSIFFDFLKYAKITLANGKQKIIQRTDLYKTEYIKVEKAYVYVELTEEIKQEAMEWVLSTIENIMNDKEFNIGPSIKKNDFFCNTLCSWGKNGLCKKKLI